MTRTLQVAAVLTTVLFLVAGCWDQRPVESRALVDAVGVSAAKLPGQYRWTFIFPNPTESTQNINTAPMSNATYAVSVTAPNWTSARELVQQQLPRVLYFGQFRVLAISPKLASNIWAQTISTFNRNGRTLKTFWIVAADPAELVVSATPGTEGPPLYTLFKQMACRCQPYRYSERAWKIYSRLTTPGVTAVFPLIRLNDGRIDNPTMATLNDQRMVIWRRGAAMGWAYLTHKVVDGNLSVRANGVEIGLIHIRGLARATIKQEGDQTVVVCRLTYRAVVDETPGTLPVTPALKAAAAQAVSQRITQMSHQAIAMAESTHTDPFGWHRELDWMDNRQGPIWTAPISWVGWTVRLHVHVRITGEGVSH